MLYFASRQTYAYLKVSFFCEFIGENVVSFSYFSRKNEFQFLLHTRISHIWDQERALHVQTNSPSV